MGRFFIEKQDISGGKVLISGKEARHMIEVMRLRLGDSVDLFDGEGGSYRGNITGFDRKIFALTVTIENFEQFSSERGSRITLVQAIPKKNKMDLIVEKATELGVHCIIPVVTERTIVRPAEGAYDKMSDRWKKIAVEASKQCGRSVTPEIRKISAFKKIAPLARDYDLSLLACLSGETIPLKMSIPHSVPGNILVMIGPEGDFSPEEADFARENGSKLVSLGPLVLKSDTAGIFALAVIGYEANNFYLPNVR